MTDVSNMPWTLPPSILRLPFRVPADLRPARRSILATGTLIALLSLSGSLFAAVVYDAVIPGRGLSSLAALLALLGLAYAAQHAIEQNRARVMRLCSAALRDELASRADPDDVAAASDVETVRAFLAGRAPLALLDLPWAPLFVALLALIHPWLGLVTLAAAALTILVSLRSARTTRPPLDAVRRARARRDAALHEGRMLHGTATAMGMRRALDHRAAASADGLDGVEEAAMSTSTRSDGAARLIRIFAQSAILAVGAVLVIDGDASGGVIFASSLLSSRALAPLDAAIGSWPSLLAADAAWRRLVHRRTNGREGVHPTLPRPVRSLRVVDLSVRAGDRMIVSEASLRLAAGDALVVMGPTGSGKTTLLAALAGAVPHDGEMLLDGAPVHLWNPDELGGHRGWSPSSDRFASASVADNIARLSTRAGAGDASIVAAAMLVGAHESIMAMPDGYRTRIGPDGLAPSRGQSRLVSMARAVHGDPFLVILDDPLSDLDPRGEEAVVALVRSIRARGGIAVVSGSSRLLASVCTHVLVMRNGAVEAFRPMGDLLRPLDSRTAA